MNRSVSTVCSPSTVNMHEKWSIGENENDRESEEFLVNFISMSTTSCKINKHSSSSIKDVLIWFAHSYVSTSTAIYTIPYDDRAFIVKILYLWQLGRVKKGGGKDQPLYTLLRQRGCTRLQNSWGDWRSTSTVNINTTNAIYIATPDCIRIRSLYSGSITWRKTST